MKKVLLSAVILSCMGLKAQVGINTTDPKASLEVAYDDAQGSKVQAIGLPHVTTAQRNNFKYEDLKDGQMIYNMTSKCVEVCIDKIWKCLSSTEGGQPQPTDPEGVGGTATFASLSNVEEDIISFKYGNQPNEKIQGEITATKISVKIPYTGATAGNVEEKILEVEGHPDLKLKIKAATISAGNGALAAEIYYTGGTYDLPLVTLAEVNQGNIKKATDVTFKVKVNGVINPATVKVNALGGIPDKQFSDADHKFLYVPVTVTGTHNVNGEPYSKVWLNQNLGSDYAKKDGGHFNPNKIGGDSKKDYRAYGSLFQWGRVDNSGYELVNWTSSTSGTRVRPNTPWYSISELTTFTDPCPNGFHVPTYAEWKELFEALTGKKHTIRYRDNWDDNKINLPFAGSAFSNGNLIGTGVAGFYWSSSQAYWDRVSAFSIDPPEISSEHVTYRNRGLSIRCIKDGQ